MASWLFRRRLQAIPDCEILEKIDEGRTGAVYKGRSRATGEMVAIKMIKAEVAQDATLLQRLKQEFQTASKLIHPNIVQALAFGHDESATYLILELVEGESLWQRVKREGRLREADALCIFTQVAQGLYYAHQNGIIHRDVKPDNILLKPNGQAKLTDFGLVKNFAEDLQLTGPSSVLGTPHFMAPEQFTNPKEVDLRCDIYGLAASLYLAITGHLPFEAPTSLDTLKMQASGELVAPREFVPSLSEQVDRAIRRAMKADPAQRYPSCFAFLMDLRERKKPGREQITPTGVQVPATALARQAQKGSERRAWVRFPCTQGTSVTLESSFHPDAADNGESWPATVLDISVGGLALILGRRFEPGTVLTVEWSDKEAGQPTSLLVHVMYAKPQGFGHWLVGGAFLQQLTCEELQALL
jgi:serine/threonine protein kinase